MSYHVKIWKGIKQTRRQMFTNLWVWGAPKNQGHKAHLIPLVHLAAAATFWNTHFQSKTYTQRTLPPWSQPQRSPQAEVWPLPHTAAIGTSRGISRGKVTVSFCILHLFTIFFMIVNYFFPIKYLPSHNATSQNSAHILKFGLLPSLPTHQRQQAAVGMF